MVFTPFDADDSLHEMMQNVYQLRGSIIGETIVIERLMDYYLSILFAKDYKKSKQLADWVFTERIPFEPKLQIFRLAVKEYNKDFISKYPTYYRDIESLMQTRNILAHYLLLNGNEEVKEFKKTETLQFIKYKNDSTIISYTKADREKTLGIVNTYVSAFTSLHSGTFLPL